jgi:proline iminopeptidase
MTDSDLRSLYPATEPFDTGILPVDGGYRLRWERCGRKGGVPVVVLHGGPGGGINADMRRFFQQESYDVLLFDQRGCGGSGPVGELQANTTWHLVEDLEALRQMCGHERWLLFGGSWGSTLALAYAQTHPERCLGLLLRGLFTGAQREVDWFFKYGASMMKPEAHEAFLAPLDPGERADPVRAYYERLTSTATPQDEQLALARQWAGYEAACSTLKPNPNIQKSFDEPDRALSLALLESHYFVHGCFFDKNTAPFARMERIRHLPCILVHGAYDLVAPPDTAWRFTKAWPEADVHFAVSGGHSAGEPEVQDLLIRSADRFAKELA